MADFFPTLGRVGQALSGDLAANDARRALTGVKQQTEARAQRKEAADLLQQQRRAGAADFRGTLDFLERNDTNSAKRLLENRAGLIVQQGRDPSDTLNLLEQIDSGDTAGAISELRRLDDFLVNTEVIGARPERKFVADVEGVNRFVDTGEPVFRGAEAASIKKIDAANEKAAKEAAKLNFDQSDKLRDEFVKQSGDFVRVRDAFERVSRSASDPSAAGDLALIFNFMKILDPGSTVREGEFATAQNSAGVPERIRATYNRVFSGQKLGDKQRTDFVDRAGKLFAGQEQIQKKNVDRYTFLANKFGLDPTTVVFDLSEGLSDPNEETIPGAAPASAGIPEVTPAPALDPNRFQGFKVLRIE